MVKLIVLVSMVRQTETGPVEYQKNDVAEFPSDHAERLIERRICKPLETAAKK